MADSYIVNVCDSCGATFDALDRVNTALSGYARNRYLNNSYLLTRVFPKRHIKLLTWYKQILEDMTWNAGFYTPYFQPDVIIGRVKILTNGL